MPHLQDSPQNSESRKWSEVGPGWLAVRAGAHLQTWPTDTRGLERPPHPGLCSVGRSTSLLGSSAIPCGRKWHHLSCCLSAETRFLLFCECLSCGAHAARKQGVVAPSQTLSRLPISCPNCKMKNAGWGTCHRLPTPRPPVKVLASEATGNKLFIETTWPQTHDSLPETHPATLELSGRSLATSGWREINPVGDTTDSALNQVWPHLFSLCSSTKGAFSGGGEERGPLP